MGTRRFSLMDSMRAIAAIAVVGFHVGNSFGISDVATSLRPYAGRLNVGVWIFFVISGFLLYRPFVAARLRGHDAPGLGGYAWRRCLRIFPAYWVALTVSAVWLASPNVLTPSDTPRLYLLIQNYWSSTTKQGLGQAWSLCVELAFYAFLGVLVFALARSRRPTRVRFELGILLLVALAGFVFRWQTLFKAVPLASGMMPWYIDTFAAGMALAVLSVYYDGPARKPRVIAAIERYPILPWALAALAYWMAATQIGFNGDYRQQITGAQELLLTELYTVIAVCAVLPAIWGEPGRGLVRRILDWRGFRFLGKVSYGIFLYQGLMITVLLQLSLRDVSVSHLSYAVWFGTVLAASTAFATLSWYIVEAPALRLKRLVPRDPTGVRPSLPPLVEKPPV